MAGKGRIRLLDDGALSQVWGGVVFNPMSFGPNGPFFGPLPGVTPSTASGLDALPDPLPGGAFGPLMEQFHGYSPSGTAPNSSGTTVYTANGQASQAQGGGWGQTDAGQNP